MRTQSTSQTNDAGWGVAQEILEQGRKVLKSLAPYPNPGPQKP